MPGSCALEPFPITAGGSSPELVVVHADVLTVSPRALLDPGRLFACDVCGRRFHRVHNLHTHRRRLHSGGGGAPPMEKRRSVYVCPEPSCLRHHPSHAMANFTAVRNHFLQKHHHPSHAMANFTAVRNHFLQKHHHGKTTCVRLSRAFGAVRADYKDNLRTCGAQDTCDTRLQPRSEKSPSPESGSGDGLGVAAAASRLMHETAATGGAPDAVAASHQFDRVFFSPPPQPDRPVDPDMEPLQLMPPCGTSARAATPAAAAWRRAPPHSPAVVPHLELSMWFGQASASAAAAARLKVDAREQRRVATAEKAAAEEARAEARRQARVARHGLAIARRLRQQAQAEFARTHAFRHGTVRQVEANLLQLPQQVQRGGAYRWIRGRPERRSGGCAEPC